MLSGPSPPKEEAGPRPMGGVGMTQLSPNILLRCTILDSAGSIKTISGVFKKSELCSHHGLEPRDLRKIDSRVPNLVPTILARRSGILINILHIRAMVKSDAVLLFDSYSTADTHLHSAFVYNLEYNLRLNTSSLPYEFRALESILASVLEALRSELSWLRIVVDDLLEALEDDIDREKLRMLLQISRKLNGFLSRSRGVKGAVTEVLESDEDMALMYLTDAKLGHARTETSDLEELELLLESFEKQVEEVIAEIEQIYANVNNTQEIVELILDSNRNKLLTLDLGTSIMTLGVSAATLFVGLFGMNLTSHLEEHAHAFYIMSVIAYIMAAVVTVGGLRLLARMRRIGLSVDSSHAAFGHAHARKPDSRLVSHARAWWWRENQFRAMQREKHQQGMSPMHGAPPKRRAMSGDPLDPAELNAGPSPHAQSGVRAPRAPLKDPAR
ncbi:Inner membrane magnesium transporter MRS2 [Malassezia equina]|uniref:Magnesium transporter n=1 Tax=Malassezia equina TaxID=1381935 RepID=A0AAF0EGY0_9BASI|nr:Inner membrane magnesium transporter MRS2 [Malassezia equina]